MLPNSGTRNHLFSSRLGLQQSPAAGPSRVRGAPKSAHKRDGSIWATVTVVREHATSPALQCLNCGMSFCGGYTHIAIWAIESDAVQARIAKTTMELATYQQHEGVFTKSYVLVNAKTMAPATWWATYGKHIPHISSVARRVLAQTVCASAAERNWSVYGQIKTTTRGRMGHAVADKRVYCHEALHNRLKLQKADYKQAIEKWDTDSDTDASDDEADLAV